MTGDERLLYPDRKRCLTCHKYLGILVIKGLYDSYECAGMVPPPKDPNDPAVPRGCRTLRREEMLRTRLKIWRWKARFDSEAEALKASRKGGGSKEVYACEFCGFFHLGALWSPTVRASR